MHQSLAFLRGGADVRLAGMAGMQGMGWRAVPFQGTSGGSLQVLVPLCVVWSRRRKDSCSTAAAKLGVQFSHFKRGEGRSSAGSVCCSLHLSVSLYPLCIPEALAGAAERGPVSRKFILNDHYCCCAAIICVSQGTGVQVGSKILC